MTYQDLINQQTKPDFYQLLMIHHDLIQEQLITKTNKQVAKELGLGQPKFSTAIQFIVAYSLINKAQ